MKLLILLSIFFSTQSFAKYSLVEKAIEILELDLKNNDFKAEIINGNFEACKAKISITEKEYGEKEFRVSIISKKNGEKEYKEKIYVTFRSRDILKVTQQVERGYEYFLEISDSTENIVLSYLNVSEMGNYLNLKYYNKEVQCGHYF